MSPFQALYNEPPPFVNYQAAKSCDPTVNQFVRDRVETLKLLKENLNKAQERMKVYADKRRSEREFQVDDEVYLRLQPYRQMSVNMRKNQKLAARYYGPYKVLKRIGKVAYKISLPPGSKIHDVFYVSQLKKKLGSKKVVQIELPGVNEAQELEAKPIAILDRKLVKRGIYPVAMVQVQWEQGDDQKVTWEDWDQLQKKFPNFNP